jgi:hypothetical protein
MVWDGLRPDLVDDHDTPNLAAFEREGTRFSHHHAIFPTLTMVNAAALATGGSPGATGILGDGMYLAPLFDSKAASIPSIGPLLSSPLDLEHSQYLALLNGPDAFKGELMGLASVGQQVDDAGGYVAIAGKQGPTFLFMDHADPATAPADHRNYALVTDDMVAPPAVADAIGGVPPKPSHSDPAAVADRDAWYTHFVITRALPAARAAAARGQSVLVVLWQRNPDYAQHFGGMGTAPAIDSLHDDDANLAHVRQAIAALGITKNTDLMVVSDHGFATIRMIVSLGDQLVQAGIKHSADSSDIVIAPNGGNDLVYLSHTAFASDEARRAMLERIVNFAEAQEWCGPIFSRGHPAGAHAGNQGAFLGGISGTFSQDAIGIRNSPRAPDLVVSFRELADMNNARLTGPANPAFALIGHGQQAVPNHSLALERPIQGVIYADAVADHKFTTGMGMHGAAGRRELHSFCAAIGPDFRRRFVDNDPTDNQDVAATIRAILHQAPVAGADGRVMGEALASRTRAAGPAPVPFSATTYLVTPGAETAMTLAFIRFGGRDYLDDAGVKHTPLGAGP